MTISIYGIPTCDSCRKAKKWFTAQDIPFTWVNTRETPPTKEQIGQWVASLGNKALRNTSGKAYRAIGEEKKSWTDDQWVDAFAADPMLLKRPLIEVNGLAVGTGFKGTDAELKERFTIP